MKSIIDWWNNLSTDAREKIYVAFISVLLTTILTVLIPKIVWPLLVRVFGWIKEQTYKRLAGLPLFNRWGVQRYKKSLRAILQRVTNPWSSQKLTLENIFVPIKVETKYNLPQLVPGQKAPEELMDLRSAAREYQRFVLVGEPGAGKSTALKNLGLAALDNRLYAGNKQSLPVYIELKRYSTSDLPLETYMTDTFKSFGFPNASKFIQRSLLRGEILLLLDGLDEVREDNFISVIERIREFCNQYGDTPLIVTSRTASYERQLDDLSAATVALTHFNDIQIVTFLRHWFFPPNKSSVDLMRILRNRPRILSICRNPLMLTIVTSLYIETEYELPSSRSEFYRTCVDAVLKRWDRVRQVERYNKYTASVKLRVLQRLALHLQSSPDVAGDIEVEELINFVAEVLPTVGLSAHLSEDIISEIVLNSGLLLYVGPQRLRFAHLTFQEFFAALEIDAGHSDTLLLDSYNKDPKRWREVCLLYCGISNRSNDLIDTLSTRDVILAANCIADGEVFDTKLAEDIIDKLEARISTWIDVEQGLNALSLLAADPNRIWAARAFEIIKTFLHSADQDIHKIIALTALANVPTEAAANELVAALIEEEPRLVAKQALVRLGPVGVPAIKRVLDSTTDRGVAQIGLEICAQVASPEVVDVLLPWLDSKDELLGSTAAWALGVLIQDPSIENSLELLKPADIDSLRQVEDPKIKEFREWVWPFKVDEGSALPTVISKIVLRLSSNVTYELAEKYGASNRLDIRVAIPVSIQLFGAISQRSNLDEKFKRAVALILIGDDSGWAPLSGPYRRQPNKAREPVPSNAQTFIGSISRSLVSVIARNRLTISLPLIFSHDFLFLKESWKHVLHTTNKGSVWIKRGRTVARLIGAFIFFMGVYIGLYAYYQLQTIKSLIYLLLLIILSIHLALFWSKRLNQKMLISAAALPVGLGAFFRDLISKHAVDSVDFMSVGASLLLTFLWPLYIIVFSYSLETRYFYLTIALTLFIAGNILFTLNPKASPDRNPWTGLVIHRETHSFFVSRLVSRDVPATIQRISR